MSEKYGWRLRFPGGTCAPRGHQLGGLGRLVKRKTVAIKLNLTGRPSYGPGYTPLEDAQWTHHRVIDAVVHLLDRAGARRIRLLESPWSSADPVEKYILAANWDPRSLLTAAPRMEFENINYRGRGRKYSRLPVPGGGYTFPAFDLTWAAAYMVHYYSNGEGKEEIPESIAVASAELVAARFIWKVRAHCSQADRNNLKKRFVKFAARVAPVVFNGKHYELFHRTDAFAVRVCNGGS